MNSKRISFVDVGRPRGKRAHGDKVPRRETKRCYWLGSIFIFLFDNFERALCCTFASEGVKGRLATGMEGGNRRSVFGFPSCTLSPFRSGFRISCEKRKIRSQWKNSMGDNKSVERDGSQRVWRGPALRYHPIPSIHHGGNRQMNPINFWETFQNIRG